MIFYAKTLCQPKTRDADFLDPLEYYQHLIFGPPMLTGHALEETCHRLVSASNLYLVVRSFVAVTIVSRTLDSALWRIVPSSGTAKDIFLLYTLELLPREYGLCDSVLVRTGAAFETGIAILCLGDGEDIGTVGADWWTNWH